jgi:SAM-dependent methyltransferase
MAHPEQRQFLREIRQKFPQAFKTNSVLEVGSLNINGTVRDFIIANKYIGIDVGAGRDVDVVCEGHRYDDPDDSFDTVISCECFEHNPHWKETFSNMHRLCKSSGYVIMTCATDGRKEHGTTASHPNDSPLTIANGWNYYKNLNEADFREAFQLDEMFSEYEFSVNTKSHDLYFWGIKKPV